MVKQSIKTLGLSFVYCSVGTAQFTAQSKSRPGSVVVETARREVNRHWPHQTKDVKIGVQLLLKPSAHTS